MTKDTKKTTKTKKTARQRSISKNVEEAFNEVPSIGDKWTRWYDVPYKFLWWSMSGWRRNISPRFIRSKANRGANYLSQFNEHDRHKAWNRKDPLNNLIVPDYEHVSVPSVWVVELFSPNEIPTFERAIAKNGWDKKRYGSVGEKGNVEALNRSRAGQGYLWWKLANIVNLDIDESKWYVLSDALRGKLPLQFRAVKLKAVQIGTGLTAVVAQFILDEEAASSLDKSWHEKHEPIIIRENGWLRPQNRKFSSFRVVQSARRDLHDTARKWMSEYCPGFFTANNEPQVVMDLLLMSKYDPTTDNLPGHNFLDALRALGVNGAGFQRNIAKELPKMLLMQTDNIYPRVLDSNRTWSLIGNRNEVTTAHDNFKYQGGDTDQGSAHYADEYAAKTMLMLTVDELLSVLENRYATLRDRAKLQHGVFRVKQLKRLGESLLSLSLTLSSVKHDLERLKKNDWRMDGADFSVEYAPHIVAHDKKLKGKSTNMSEELQNNQTRKLERLTEADKDYRDILSTVASLGASANNIKLGRWALAVAALSLLVALIALTVQAELGETIIP